VSREHIHMPTNIGDKVADVVAQGMGSWTYIIIQTVIVVLWIALNSMGWFVWKWDPMPFILLNLIFSTQASYAAPIIMKSQNRQASRDRARDDLEAQEVSELFSINKTQLEILKQQSEILDLLKGEKQP
jgi:uncharacterized membrane protein